MSTQIMTYGGSTLSTNGNAWVYINYNPLNLPANTMRFVFSDLSYDPNTDTSARSGYGWVSGSTWTRVSYDPNVWDYYLPGTSWSGSFSDTWNDVEHNSVRILGANTTGLTDMDYMLWENTAIVEVCQFDMMSVTTASDMMTELSITEIPYVLMPNVTNVGAMYNNCRLVEKGALDMYKQFSTTPSVFSYTWCFHDCGIDTTTGAAELAQIPSDWK